MANPVNKGNATRFHRLKRALNHGLSDMRNAQTRTVTSALYLTYYLLVDGKIVTHREWRQLNSPHYLVAGSRAGCEGHLARTTA